MNIQVNVKDLPEAGVRIIAFSDPSFGERVKPFLKGSSYFMDRIKPFSVLIENTGQLAIVGSRINWEIVKSDGTVYQHRIGSANPYIFLGGDKIRQTTLGAAIPPHSTRFISLVGSAAEGEQLDLSTIEVAFQGSQSESQEFKQALDQGNSEEAFNKSFIAKLMTEATSITISVDGIFYEDGTFIGDNKTGLFEQVKAFVDAEYDLTTEILLAQNQGKTPEEIVTQVTDFLSAPSRTKGEVSPLEKDAVMIDAYHKHRTLFAQTLLKKKERFGAKETVRKALELLNKPRVELKRKLSQ